MDTICYINNIPMSSRECKLFDLYKVYLEGKVNKSAFINFGGYGDMFETARSIYNKVINWNYETGEK